MATKKRGRPLINDVPINRQLFEAAMKYRKISMAALASKSGIEVHEKTIQRIKQTQMTNAKMLNMLAKELNVDPDWLSGRLLKIFPSLKNNKEYLNPAKHPYNEVRKQMDSIDMPQLLRDILVWHGVSADQYQLLPEEQREAFKMELDLAIQMVIFCYLGPVAKESDPFLSNQELRELSLEVLKSEAYGKLFDLIMI